MGALTERVCLVIRTTITSLLDYRANVYCACHIYEDVPIPVLAGCDAVLCKSIWGRIA